jgi:hypothetical protein
LAATDLVSNCFVAAVSSSTLSLLTIPQAVIW